uniref:Uncharacterized protein n=1 Tax=Oryza punctata TaxID=4537 RepID=A0A0E0JV34_ORYPU
MTRSGPGTRSLRLVPPRPPPPPPPPRPPLSFRFPVKIHRIPEAAGGARRRRNARLADELSRTRSRELQF